MRYTNKLNLPQAIVNAVINDPYSSEGSDISCTTLIKPVRQVALTKIHADDIEKDVSDCIYALFGSAMHNVIERSGSSDIQELRLFNDIEGWKVSGQLDYYEIPTKKITDFKVTSVYQAKAEKHKEWEQQLNILAWLCSNNGMVVEDLSIVALFRDWSKAQAKRAKHWEKYPQTQIMEFKIKLWEEEEQERYIRKRVREHQDAQLQGLWPLCTDEERWATPAKFAVKKDGRKTAIRVLDSAADAQKYIEEKQLDEKHYIEARPRTYNRCEGYCDVAQHCRQFSRDKGGK